MKYLSIGRWVQWSRGRSQTNRAESMTEHGKKKKEEEVRRKNGEVRRRADVITCVVFNGLQVFFNFHLIVRAVSNSNSKRQVTVYIVNEWKKLTLPIGPKLNDKAVREIANTIAETRVK